MFIKRFVIAFCLIVFPVAAFGEDASKQDNKQNEFYLSPTGNPKIVAEYPLNEEFLVKMENVQKELSDASIKLSQSETGNDASVDGLVKTISKNERIMNILKKNTLEPKDYVLGYLALQASLAAASSLDDQDALFDDSATVSKENLEFGKQFADRIRKLLDQ